MSAVPPDPQDPYARLQYRRLIAWPERIRREAPFLQQVLGSGPENSLLDLGCGTGEHSLYFARDAGTRVVGLDRSPAQLDEARRQAGITPVRFVEGDIARLDASLQERFGSAFCLGNTLVHLLDEEQLEAACQGVHAALLPGGSWVTQILNYERILAMNERSLPLSFRPDKEGELVFLRLLRPLENGRVQFFPTTLRWRPEAEVPVEVMASRAVTLRAWRRDELAGALTYAGFESVRWYGALDAAAFNPIMSTDLVFVASRSAP